MNRSKILTLALVICGLAHGLFAAPTSTQSVAEVFEREVAALDSDEFATRQRAIERLEELARDKAAAPSLAELVQHKLLDGSPSFEVRAFLEDYAKRLPAVVVTPPGDIAAEQLDRLMQQLDDPSSSVRMSATRRIAWLGQSPNISLQIWKRLSERLTNSAQLPRELKRWESLRSQMRSAWLAAGGDWHNLPTASEQQINQWIETLSAAEDNESRDTSPVYKELENALLRDDQVSLIARRLQAALEQQPSPRGTDLVQQLLQWTRPAMIAEVWHDHRQVNTQHLIVGVPQINFDPNPNTHFDRIDDESANCVSGVNLAPGVYPVGVANTRTRFDMESPSFDNLQYLYHLVNLSTPRRRMAYEFQTKRSERIRLKEMSQRTIDWYLRRGTPLKETEVATLAQLDAEVVSKFAGHYFTAIEDRELPGDMQSVTGQASIHRAVCLLLMRVGTPAAIPALEELGKKLELSEQAPLNTAWLSALVIAHRQPWPEVDDWLSALAQRTDRLLLNADVDADLGATAAAMLLRRHELAPQDFGLEQAAVSGPIGPPQFDPTGLKVYKATRAQRAAVVDWWRKQKADETKAASG